MRQLGIVNLAARGMFVASVARNAHGPNEFLHIPTGKHVSVVIAQVLADNHAQEGALTSFNVTFHSGVVYSPGMSAIAAVRFSID